MEKASRIENPNTPVSSDNGHELLRSEGLHSKVEQARGSSASNALPHLELVNGDPAASKQLRDPKHPVPGRKRTDTTSGEQDESVSELGKLPPELQGEPEQAEDKVTVKVLKGGTIVTKHADGQEDFQYPDGTQFIRMPDGTEINIAKDGTEYAHFKDGGFSVQRPDGTLTVIYADGGRSETDAKGVTIAKHADGTTTELFPDESVVTWNKDGSVTLSRGLSTSTQHPDGTFVHEDSGAEYRELPNGDLVLKFTAKQYDDEPDGLDIVLKREVQDDGSLLWKSEDGSVRLLKGIDGTVELTMDEDDWHYKQICRPDGSIEQTHSEGLKINAFADGTIEINPPEPTDVSSMQILKDKSVHVVFKNGLRETIGKDGSVTTIKPDGKSEMRYVHVTMPDGYEGIVKLDGPAPETTLLNGKTIRILEDEDEELWTVGPHGSKIKLTMTAEDRDRFDLYRESMPYRGIRRALPQALEVFGADSRMAVGIK